jgi:uncharacterized protein YllA (UPF0747 family)
MTISRLLSEEKCQAFTFAFASRSEIAVLKNRSGGLAITACVAASDSAIYSTIVNIFISNGAHVVHQAIQVGIEGEKRDYIAMQMQSKSHFKKAISQIRAADSHKNRYTASPSTIKFGFSNCFPSNNASVASSVIDLSAFKA